jgi:putative transcriptional regulator
MTGPSFDVKDLLPLHALGALDPEDAALVEQAVAADPELRAALDAWREITSAMPVPSVAPGADVRARLMADIDASVQPGTLDRFAPRVASIFDVTIDKARMFLGWIADPTRWEPAPLPGVQLIHLPPGPAYASADCGFVKLPPGFHFPRHGHHGEELTVVLQGSGRDSDGNRLSPGTELMMPGGAEHDFVIDEGGEEYIFAVRFHGIYGIDLDKKA